MLFAETANASPPRISIVALVPRCSSSQILAAPLGDFDPSLLENGFYQIRLVASDLLGREVSTEPTLVQVDGKLKVGLFRVAFEDLNIPMAGIPLAISREYDSRRSTSNGDFGPGWSLGFKSIRVVKNRNLGTDWKQYSVQNGLFKLYYTEPVKSRRVVLVLPDDSTLAFEAYAYTRNDPRLPENASTVIFATAALMKFRPLKGTKGTLEPLDQNNAPYEYLSVSQGSFDLLDPAGNLIDEAWNPSRFRYTTPDGTSFIVDEKLGLLSQNTPDGQSLSVLRDAQQRIIGVRHSSGPEIRVDRDAAGRVSSLTDPAGNSVDYDYDAQGRLISVNDRVGATTSFDYQVPGFPHYLSGITDPRGLKVMSNAYSPEGRLVGQSDADGNAMSFCHDLPQRRESVTDRLGNVTVHEYDYAGNVTKTIDPLGNVTLREYDDEDNEIKTTDALGHITRRTFDAQKNPLSESSYVTLADGSVAEAVQSTSYDSAGRPLAITDAAGRTMNFSYDSLGHLTQLISADGQITRYQYDNAGNISAVIDPLGNRSETDYDDYGREIEERRLDASGKLLAKTTHSVDALGRRLESRVAVLVDGVQTGTAISSFTYDAEGRMLTSIAPDGGASQNEYNQAGQLVKTIDPLGHEALTEYDAQGRAFKQTDVRGTVSSREYDLEGRVITETLSSGSQTFITRNEYDSLGRLVKSISPTGGQTRTEYDVLGRSVAVIDPTGLRTEYVYDPSSGAGRQIEVRTPATTLRYGYDISGRRVEMTDALGKKTSFVHDDNGRLLNQTFADDSQVRFEYDAIGRQTAKIDEMGKRTEFAYDSSGNLASVKDAMNGLTRFEYDSRGLMTKQIDANNHETSFGYDLSGRRVSRSLPLGMSEIANYDLLGRMTSRRDFSGKTTSFKYEAGGALIEKTADANHPSLNLSHAASKITYERDYAGRLIKGRVWHGTSLLHETTQAFDASGRLVSRGTDEGLISYTHDAVGKLLSAKSDNLSGLDNSYSYDSAGRLAGVTAKDASGVNRSSAYSYDAVGNLASQKHGAITQSFAYDLRNRLSGMNASINNLSFAYTVNLCGRRTQAIEGSRIFNYSYDDLHRLIEESEVGGGRANYTLDAVGNRTQRGSTLDGVSVQAASYDANDRLVGDSYDANGNTLSSSSGTDVYDFENRLIRRTVGGRIIDLYYDSEGQRVAKTVAGLETAYLLDVQNPTGYAQCVEELQQIGGQLSVVHRAYFGLQLFAEEEVSWTGSTASSVLRFAHQDGHGSTRALSDLNGSISGEFTYDAFGILRESSGILDLHHRYCSEFYDADLGMYYLRARWYQPDLGRFWTMDTFEGRSGEPITLHKYLYCGGDPINGRDPSGMETLTEMTAVQTLKSGLMQIGGRIKFLMNAYDKVSSLIDIISGVQQVIGAIEGAQLPDLTSSLTSTGSPNVDFKEALESFAENLPKAISTGIGNWSSGFESSAAKGDKLSAFLIYMPLPIAGIPQREIKTNTSVKLSKSKIPINLIFGAANADASGQLFGLGVKMGINRQLIRMDFHGAHGGGPFTVGSPSNPTGHGGVNGVKPNEVSVWADGSFHYHIRKWNQ
jgi:RHS repeat-associated protein